jgi:hypothetical protein
MPHKDCTLTQALIMGSGFSLHKTEWIAVLLVTGMVFIAAVTGVLAVPLRALWECIHRAAILLMGSHFGSCLPLVRGVRL